MPARAFKNGPLSEDSFVRFYLGCHCQVRIDHDPDEDEDFWEWQTTRFDPLDMRAGRRSSKRACQLAAVECAKKLSKALA